MHYITTKTLDIKTISEIVLSKKTLALSEEVKANITDCRTFLEKKIAQHGGAIYGINTGFGSLCDVLIPDKDLEQLQTNLVMSHACGTGDEVPALVVKLMLLLKVQSL